MLSLVLWTHDAGTSLRGTLQALTDVRAQPGVELILVDSGSRDDTLSELTQYAAGGVPLIRIDADQAAGPTILTLMRAQAQHPYVLMLRPGDRVDPDALPGLIRYLEQERPATALLDHTHWLGDPALQIPAPDADRLAALPDAPDTATLRQLSPDLRRVLVHRDHDLCTAPSGDLAADWATWDRIAALDPTLFPGRAVLSLEMPRITATDLLQAAARLLGQSPDAPALVWAADLLALADPDPACLEAAADLPSGATAPAPLGPILTALQAGDRATALACLAMVAARRERQMTTLLSAQVTRLRRDLDLALPGPDYLRALYDRIRSQ